MDRDFVEMFHSAEYIDRLMMGPSLPTTMGDLEDFGLVDDCPVFEGINRYCAALAGASSSVVAAVKNKFDCTIFWDGGRHHASSSCASGFCYINGNGRNMVSYG
jgi:histone deacetylase 8